MAGEYLHPTFFDQNGDGVPTGGTEPRAGLPLVATNIRFRDGSYSNFNNTDLNGNAGFNEVFPLFSWYVMETDTTRYKNTGTHVVYDAGGPADGSALPATGTVRKLHHWRQHGEYLEKNPSTHPPAGTGRGLLLQRGLHRLLDCDWSVAANSAAAIPPAESIRLGL